MIDSDDSCGNIDYDTDATDDIDLDNLTEELEKINNETKKISEIDSDNMSLTSNDSNCIEINVTEKDKNKSLDNIELFNEVKKMSKSKLLKQKKIY